jgi:hypothetical protein
VWVESTDKHASSFSSGGCHEKEFPEDADMMASRGMTYSFGSRYDGLSRELAFFIRKQNDPNRAIRKETLIMSLMKYHEGGQITKVQLVEVGDVPGHMLAVSEGAGVIFFDDGSVGITSGQGLADVINGNGTGHGYAVVRYDDGSTHWEKGTYTATVQPDGSTRMEGTSEFTGGTGRFEGIQGSNRYTGKRFPIVPGVPIQYMWEGEATYTLPSK